LNEKRKRDNKPGFSTQIADPEAQAAFNGSPFDGCVNPDPEKDVENECIVTEILEKHKGFRSFKHPVIFQHRFDQQAPDFQNR